MDNPHTLGLIETIKLLGNKNQSKEVLAKIDTGASMSSIDIKLADSLGLNEIVGTKKVKSASGTSLRPVINVSLILKGKEIISKMTLAERSHMKYPILIGSDIMKDYSFKVNPKQTPSKLPKSNGNSKYSAALISLGSVSSMWTSEEMNNYFGEVDNLDVRFIEIKLDSTHPEILYKGEKIKNYDCVYVKGSFRFAQLLESITRSLYKESYMPIHPSSFDIVHDKLSTHLILQEENIPMPTTYFASSPNAAEAILKKINYPVILKFPKGTQGKGVMYADSYITAKTILDALTSLKQPFIIQEFIDTKGEDIRVIVCGDKIVASMKRKSVQGDIRSNIHAGGAGISFTPDPKMAAIALKTAKVLKADVVGVDLLESRKGPIVIEANISPGLQGITKATNLNVAKKIAKFLYEKTLEIKEGKNENAATKILEEMGVKSTEAKDKHEIVTNIELRGQRIILPKIVTEMCEFKEDEEVVIKVDKGKFLVKKF